MPHLLQNENLKVTIDLPHEHYQQTRFDWTGKIVSILYKDKLITSQEIALPQGDTFGKGLYNEFGFKQPLGYEEIKAGEWYHKIGVGLLQKEEQPYDFFKTYKVKPAHFKITKSADRLIITCQSASANGYAYTLTKEIKLQSGGLIISYHLTNTGTKKIHTNEYMHNFLSLNQATIGQDYSLHFPFVIEQTKFDEHIDSEGLLAIGSQDISFKSSPTQAFFVSDLSGGKAVAAGWILENKKEHLTVSETCDFKTKWIALWGAGHVISPELYLDIQLPSGHSQHWTRTFHFSTIQ